MPRRGENVFKRKDGRWEARYVKEVSIDGSKKYGSVYAKTYREVKTKQLACINQPLSCVKISTSTVDDIMREWLEHNKNQLKISSYQRYCVTIQNHISKQLGKIQIKHLTTNTIVKFSDDLLTNQHLSKETANQVLILLGMGLDFVKTQYQVAVPDVHLLKSARPKTRVLSVSEQQILVQYLLSEGDIFSFGILLALYTGLRIGELCALKWEDFTDNEIHVDKTMQRLKSDTEKTEVMILPPKTSSSDRVIPVMSALAPIIERYMYTTFHKPTEKIYLVLTAMNLKVTLIQ